MRESQWQETLITDLELLTGGKSYQLRRGTPERLPLTTLAALFDWYCSRLCNREMMDPRGYRVHFLDSDFVHLVKLTDKYGKEPKNTRMTIEQIQSGRIRLRPDRMSVQRAQELSWAEQIITTPDLIVPNWQVLGRANPGDAYIKNFGADGGRKVYRVLIGGHAGLKRRAVTIFPRERFTTEELTPILWP